MSLSDRDVLRAAMSSKGIKAAVSALDKLFWAHRSGCLTANGDEGQEALDDLLAARLTIRRELFGDAD